MNTPTPPPGPEHPVAEDLILEVDGLSVVYEPVGAPPTRAVREVSFSIKRGEFVGLVGESGSGKSTVGFAVTRLTKSPARHSGGRIVFNGQDISKLTPDQVRRQRRGGFAMVLQSGMNALNPVRTVFHHFCDIFAAHGHVDSRHRRERTVELLRKVALPEGVADQYPGELSGGMRQRVTIALALSLEPELMVFDEPTTALDVIVQHEVMETIRELQRREGFTAVLISHDLGTVLEAAQRVLVMHDGAIVEDAPSAEILHRPQHQYTQMLLSHFGDPRAGTVQLPGFNDGQTSSTPASLPSGSDPVGAGSTLSVRGLHKNYRVRPRGSITAVDNVSFDLEPGGALALVGQSGSGKSTIGKLVTGIERPTSGDVHLGELSVGTLPRRRLRDLYRRVQMVFQDPYAALNPLHSVDYVLSRPLVNMRGLKGREMRDRVHELLEIVGLTPVEAFAAKLPHQLSGGQRQRVVIARALACEPEVIVADEPVSMLDLSLRAGVLRLLRDLRHDTGVSLLYITHDLLSARMITDRIMVLHHGRVVEAGATAEVMRNPQAEYTERLLDAIPTPHRIHQL